VSYRSLPRESGGKGKFYQGDNEFQGQVQGLAVNQAIAKLDTMAKPFTIRKKAIMEALDTEMDLSEEK